MSFRLQDVLTTVILPTTIRLMTVRWQRQQLYCLPNLTKLNQSPNLTLRGYLTRRRRCCRFTYVVGKMTVVETAVGEMTFSQNKQSCHSE